MNSSYQLLEDIPKSNFKPCIVIALCLIFFITSIALIGVICFLPIQLPNPQKGDEIAAFFKTIQKPVDDALEDVSVITNSLGRMNFFAQMATVALNETVVQIDSSIQQDNDLIHTLVDTINGFVQFLEDVNNSLIGFLIKDSFVESMQKLSKQFRLFIPELVILRKKMSDINSNIKGCFSAVDVISNRMDKIIRHTTPISHLFNAAIKGIDVANSKLNGIVYSWLFTKTFLILMCIFVSFSSLAVAIGCYFRFD